MRVQNETLDKLWIAFGVLTQENNSGQYLRECSRTTGTPFRLSDLYDDLGSGITEDAFQEKYWVCFQASWRNASEAEARATARDGYKGYWSLRQKEIDALKFVEETDARMTRADEVLKFWANGDNWRDVATGIGPMLGPAVMDGGGRAAEALR